MIECTTLDPMNELFGLTGGWHIVKPAPRAHLIVGKSDNSAGQQVAAAEIVQQPAVDAELLQGGLDFREIEHHNLSSYSNRTALVSISRPVRTVSGSYSSGRRALIQRRP